MPCHPDRIRRNYPERWWELPNRALSAVEEMHYRLALFAGRRDGKAVYTFTTGKNINPKQMRID